MNFVLIFCTSFISYHGDQSSGQCAYRLIRRQLVRCDASSGQSTVCCCWWIVSLLITTDLLITRSSEINASPITFPVFSLRRFLSWMLASENTRVENRGQPKNTWTMLGRNKSESGQQLTAGVSDEVMGSQSYLYRIISG